MYKFSEKVVRASSHRPRRFKTQGKKSLLSCSDKFLDLIGIFAVMFDANVGKNRNKCKS